MIFSFSLSILAASFFLLTKFKDPFIGLPPLVGEFPDFETLPTSIYETPPIIIISLGGAAADF